MRKAIDMLKDEKNKDIYQKTINEYQEKARNVDNFEENLTHSVTPTRYD